MERFLMMEYDHHTVLEVPYLCGCFMAFRNSILKKSGLFDERFFLYPEDIDITRRICFLFTEKILLRNSSVSLPVWKGSKRRESLPDGILYVNTGFSRKDFSGISLCLYGVENPGPVPG